jgi:hypothetical protein
MLSLSFVGPDPTADTSSQPIAHNDATRSFVQNAKVDLLIWFCYSVR